MWPPSPRLRLVIAVLFVLAALGGLFAKQGLRRAVIANGERRKLMRG